MVPLSYGLFKASESLDKHFSGIFQLRKSPLKNASTSKCASILLSGIYTSLDFLPAGQQYGHREGGIGKIHGTCPVELLFCLVINYKRPWKASPFPINAYFSVKLHMMAIFE